MKKKHLLHVSSERKFVPNHLTVAHLINTNLGRRKYSGFVALVLFWNQVGPNRDVGVKFSEGHNVLSLGGIRFWVSLLFTRAPFGTIASRALPLRLGETTNPAR